MIMPRNFKRYPHLDLVVTKTDMGGEKVFIFVEYYKLQDKYQISVLYHPDDMMYAREILSSFLQSTKFANVKTKMKTFV